MEKNQKDLKKDDKTTTQSKVGQQKNTITPTAIDPKSNSKNADIKKDNKKSTSTFGK